MVLSLKPSTKLFSFDVRFMLYAYNLLRNIVKLSINNYDKSYVLVKYLRLFEMKERLKDLMDILHVNKSTLAADMGLTPSAITDFFKGRSSNLSSSSLGKIAVKYRVNLNWLLTGEGEMLLSDKPISHEVPTAHMESADLELLKDIIEIVTDIQNKKGLKVPGAKFAEIIFLLYEDLKNDKEINDNVKERALKLINIAG